MYCFTSKQTNFARINWWNNTEFNIYNFYFNISETMVQECIVSYQKNKLMIYLPMDYSVPSHEIECDLLEIDARKTALEKVHEILIRNLETGFALTEKTIDSKTISQLPDNIVEELNQYFEQPSYYCTIN